MDVVLWATSIAGSMVLPRQILLGNPKIANGISPQKTEEWSMKVAIGLSLGLFSLSLLEACPESWSLFISMDNSAGENDDADQSLATRGGILPIAFLYWILLWLLSAILFVVLPALAGRALSESFVGTLQGWWWQRSADDQGYSAYSNDKDKDRKYYHSRNQSRWNRCFGGSPWWLRLTGQVLGIVGSNLWHFGKKMIFPSNSGNSSNNSSSKSSSTKAATTSSSSTDDVEFQALLASTTGGKSTSRPPRVRRIWGILGGLLGVLLAIGMACLVSSLVIHTPVFHHHEHHKHKPHTVLSTIVSWLCAVGLILSSLLNGFGSVSMPYGCLSGLYLKPIRPEVIIQIETELLKLKDMMTQKNQELLEKSFVIESNKTVSTGPNPSSSASGSSSTKTGSVRSTFAAAGWWSVPAISPKTATPTSSASGSFGNLGQEISQRKQVLQNEIDFLEVLCKDLQQELDELRVSQAKAAAARTPQGRIRSYVGIVFSIVLLVRLGSAGLSIWKGHHHVSKHNSGDDIVTSVLLWLTGHDLVAKKDFNMISQAVSLALTAILSVSQIRFFLNVTTIVHQKWMRFYRNCYCLGTSSNQYNTTTEDPSASVNMLASQTSVLEAVLSQIFAGAMGCYFLSCLVVTKMMLPEEFGQGFARALGSEGRRMDVFSIRASFVNQVFCFSAAISLLVLGMIFGIQRQSHLRNQSWTTTPKSAKPSSFASDRSVSGGIMGDMV